MDAFTSEGKGNEMRKRTKLKNISTNRHKTTPVLATLPFSLSLSQAVINPQ